MPMDAPEEPLLLTPGPLTTAPGVRQAMLRDWGSRDTAFIAMNAAVLDRLVELAHGQGSHVGVPLQGSGTFVVEAMLGHHAAARRQGAGAGQWRLWRAHRPDGRLPGRPSAIVSPRTTPSDLVARKRRWRRMPRSPTSSPSIARPRPAS